MSKILEKYEEFCGRTDRTYSCPDHVSKMHYLMGLVAEVGEVSALFQKAIREDKTLDVYINREEFMDEMGDVLWYFTRLANSHGLSIQNIMNHNRFKLNTREEEEK